MWLGNWSTLAAIFDSVFAIKLYQSARIYDTRFPFGKCLREWRKNETQAYNIRLSVGK